MNFSEMVEAELRKAGQGGKVNTEEDINDEQLNTEAYKYAEPLIPILTFPLIKLLFHNSGKLKKLVFSN